MARATTAAGKAVRAFGVVVAALLAIVVLWAVWIALHIAWYSGHAPRETSFMAQRADEARAKQQERRRCATNSFRTRGSRCRSSAR